MGMVRIYTYVGTYTYAYVPTLCNALCYRGCMILLVGSIARIHTYRRERGERRKYYYYQQQHKEHTFSRSIHNYLGNTLPQPLSPKPTYAIPRKSPREFPTRTQTRRFVSSFKLHCKSVYLSPMWIQVGSTLLIRALIKSKLQTTRKKYHQDDEFRIMCPF